MRFNLKENNNRMQLIANVAGVAVEELPEWCQRFLGDVGIVETVSTYASQLQNLKPAELNLVNPSRAGNNIRTVCQDDAVSIMNHTLTWLQQG